MEFALHRHKFLYCAVVETSWVFIPSGLPLLDDVSGCTPFAIVDRLGSSGLSIPGSGGFC